MVVITSPPLVPLPNISIPEWVASNPFANYDDDVVFYHPEINGKTTWSQFIETNKQLSSGFQKLWSSSLSYGSIVTILSPNHIYYPTLYQGVMGAGYIPSPASPTATAEELAGILRIAKPRAAVIHPDLVTLYFEAAKIVGDYQNIPYVLMERSSDSGTRNLLTLEYVQELGRNNMKPFVPLKRHAKDSLALVPFSSGTSGPFKGVSLSHQNLIANVLQLRQGWPDYWEPRPTIISFLADFHSYSFNQVCICGPVSGLPCVRLLKYDFEEFLRCIEKYKVNAIPMVPPVAIQLARSPLPDKYDTSSLKRFMVSAAPIKPEMVDVLRKRYKVTVLQTFGCTEVAPTSHALPEYLDFNIGSVGKLLPGMQCKVVDENGKDLGPEQEGEIWWKGPNVMMGYYGNEKSTKEAFSPDGWLKSGDIGKFNRFGLFWITDRLKELIKVRGFQVAPAELEFVLLTHPLVKDCAVKRGIPVDSPTELPVAFLVVDPEHRTEKVAKQIKDYVASKVAYYKRLEGGVMFVDTIPKNASGKILRRHLPTLQLKNTKQSKL